MRTQVEQVNKKNNKVNLKSNKKDKLKKQPKSNVKVHDTNNTNNQDFLVMSCRSTKNNLPTIQIKFGENILEALIDTGANLSLIQPSALENIKETTKVHHISRSVTIHTLSNATIPYISAVEFKFKLKNSWFQNQFFVTTQNWTSNYQIILGYDFLQRNKLIIDPVKRVLIKDKDIFEFQETLPNMSQTNNIKSKAIKDSFARSSANTQIPPNSDTILKLTIPSYLNK